MFNNMDVVTKFQLTLFEINSFKRLICELIFTVCKLKLSKDVSVLIRPCRSETLKGLI